MLCLSTLRNGGTPQGFWVQLLFISASNKIDIRHCSHLLWVWDLLRNSNQFFLSYGCNIIQYIKKKLNKLMLWTLAPTIEYVLTFNTRDTKMSWSAFWVNYISIRIIEKVQLKPDFCRNSSSCLWQTGKLSERKSVFNSHHF